ncbi:M23 family metallopeptidase [Leucobacter rhizosphaerae]|uniref:M23 family metallopeptidase n=1 Tax=Leucobacter rhizosphaerae TaxID=2932245 RepID=A0ABY4FXI9_9MICO|nr:M23 family metallopeptidase [Leucobacter rhizosphaerae]UOQ60985.1 M23 family metallopeptidase [Leucobacter rhizosphaerae]
MPDTTAPAPARYPSRKALRLQQSAQTEGSPAPSPYTVDDLAPLDATPEVTTSLTADPVVQSPEPAGLASVRVPRRAHVPHRSIPTERRAEPVARTTRAKLAGVAAATSVCGLVLAAALPITENAGFAEPAAAAEQRLFSTADAPEGSIPDSLSAISAVETDDSLPTAYTFRPEAVVNYPFTETVLLTDPFGYRTAPVEQFHDAQDFAAAAGTPIKAIADGKVLEAGFATDGCGFGLKLEHSIDGKTVTSRYCHMQMGSHTLEVDDAVKMGDDVGRVGNTGMSFGAHLHLALVVDDVPTDPMPFLAKYSRVDR